MELAKMPPSKRTPPAPPVPTKAKPAPMLASKSGGPQPCASAIPEQGRAGDPDADGFNVVPVTVARLSHPTATRPRVPGQRPPSFTPGSAGGPCGGKQPRGSPHAGLCPSAGERLALEDLREEVRTLRILAELMRAQHLRELEELRLELGQERLRRRALQAEIERLREGLPG